MIKGQERGLQVGVSLLEEDELSSDEISKTYLGFLFPDSGMFASIRFRK